MIKNIAVIGCGHWGKNLIRNFNEIGALSAICDPNLKLAQKYSKQYKVKNLSFEEILSDETIEGVVLAVPAPLHASMAIMATKFKKHIYVEKPLAMDIEEGMKILEAVKENNVKLMVGHLLQYHPAFKKLLKLITENKIGKIQHLYSNRLSFGKIRTEEDVIWSFAPHDISMVLSLAKEQPCFVNTTSASFIQNGLADSAAINLIFPSGLKANINVSWINPYKEQKLVVIGETGMLVFDDMREWQEKLAFFSNRVSFTDGIPETNKSEIEFLMIEESEPLKNECLHFVDIVNTVSEPLTDGIEGLNVLKVLNDASESNELYKKTR